MAYFTKRDVYAIHFHSKKFITGFAKIKRAKHRLETLPKNHSMLSHNQNKRVIKSYKNRTPGYGFNLLCWRLDAYYKFIFDLVVED